MTRALTLLIVAGLLSGCGAKMKRLSDTEFMSYNALKVWWDKDDEKAYLKGKTQEERDAWLKAHPEAFVNDGNPQTLSYYDRYFALSDNRREEIAAGLVAPGWSFEEVAMAWGLPHKKSKLAGRPATRSELFVYRFEVDWEGNTHVWIPGSKLTSKAIELFQLDVYIDDGQVTEIIRKDAWE
jgi:uncharacterized protein YceK